MDKSKPEPVNIVDLATQKLTIVYPHNSSFVQIDLMQAEAQPGGAKPTAGISHLAADARAGAGRIAELKKTDKTKKIQGFDCTLYTISDRMELSRFGRRVPRRYFHSTRCTEIIAGTTSVRRC